MTIKSELDQAIAHHRGGRLSEARLAYQSILTKEPDHADAMHLLGMLHHNTGCGEEAEKLIRRAIEISPVQAVYHSNLGIVLAAHGKLTEAIAAYRIADSLNPKSSETLNNLGVALHATGSTTEALHCFQQAVLLRPDYLDARNNLLALLKISHDTAPAFHALGDLFRDAGRTVEAIGFYQRAIEFDPQAPSTHNNLGNVFFSQGEAAEALLHFQRAVELQPKFAQAWNNLGNALKEFGRLDEAISAYRRSVELQPDAPESLGNLGNALRDTGQWEAAMECYQRAIILRPNHPPTLNNIGNAFCERGDWNSAIAAFELAVAGKPDYGDAINNLGTALEEIGHRDRAMDCYRSAQKLDPKLISPPWNIALLQLLQGDYKNGWIGYENRWRQKKQSRARRDFREPMLIDPAQIQGKRILLHAEQGFGDAIQFCRYASMVADVGGSVILECPLQLHRLCASLRGVHEVVVRGEPLPTFDLHCPLMSLPMLFGTEITTVPDTVPYLSAEPADAFRWQEKFANEPDALRVGLVWAGHTCHQKDRHRSLPLAAFAPLAAVPNVRFFSLQMGEPARQLALPEMQLVDWTAEVDDFADTAALITQLDLVIAVDTAVCHLAGALGKPVWILLAFQPDWRWLLEREDSPWYPTVRLFRQSERERWNEPIERLANELAHLAATPVSPSSTREQSGDAGVAASLNNRRSKNLSAGFDLPRAIQSVSPT